MKIGYLLGGTHISLLNDGTPNAGGSIAIYEAGTTTPKDSYPTYAAALAGTPVNTLDDDDRVTLDAYGRAEIWVAGAIKFQVYDANGVVVGAAVDNWNGEDSNAGTSDADGLNMIRNGSFESWTDGEPDDITVSAYTGAQVTQDSADSNDGASSVKVVSAAAGGATFLWPDYFEVSPLYEYLGEILIENASGTTNIARVLWYDEDKVQLAGGDAYTDIYNNTTTHAAWAREYAFLTPPATARYGRAYAVAVDPSGISGTARFDGFKLSKATERVNDLDVDGTATMHEGIVLGSTTELSKTVKIFTSATASVGFRCAGMARGTTSNGGASGTGESNCGIIGSQATYTAVATGAAKFPLNRAPNGESYSIQVTCNGSLGSPAWGYWEISGSDIYVYTRDETGALVAATFNLIIFEHDI